MFAEGSSPVAGSGPGEVGVPWRARVFEGSESRGGGGSPVAGACFAFEGSEFGGGVGVL